MFSWYTLLIVLGLANCGQRVVSCRSLDGKYPEINLPTGAAIAGSQAAVVKARKIVETCYPLHPIQPTGGTIGFNRAIKANDGFIYITYNMQLWNDVALAFKVNQDGNVLGAYRYSSYAE